MWFDDDMLGEWASRWWLENRWDTTVSAGANLLRFREWFFAEEWAF